MIAALSRRDGRSSGTALIFIATLSWGAAPSAAHAACDDPPAELVIWSGCDLSDRDLQRATLVGADLSGAILQRANLYGALLTYANLTETDLTDANLMVASLEGARFTNADLTGAILHFAHVNGASFEGAILAHAIWTDARTCAESSVSTCE